jgi:hypothetical protein
MTNRRNHVSHVMELVIVLQLIVFATADRTFGNVYPSRDSGVMVRRGAKGTGAPIRRVSFTTASV